MFFLVVPSPPCTKKVNKQTNKKDPRSMRNKKEKKVKMGAPPSLVVVVFFFCSRYFVVFLHFFCSSFVIIFFFSVFFRVLLFCTSLSFDVFLIHDTGAAKEVSLIVFFCAGGEGMEQRRDEKERETR